MKLINIDRFLKETPIVNGKYDKKNANPHFIAGVKSVVEMLENQTPAYVEMDRIRYRAVNDCLKELIPALGIHSISVTDKMLQMQYDGNMYYVGVRTCSPKAIGQIVRDLIIYGKCDYDFTVKEMKRK